MKPWLEIPLDSDFSIHNLPYGLFAPPGKPPRMGLRLGNHVIDCFRLWQARHLDVQGLSPYHLQNESLNSLISEGKELILEVRSQVQKLMLQGEEVLQKDEELLHEVMWPIEQIEVLAPIEVGDYTDFYASEHHAQRVGELFRDPQNALFPNWKHLPIGYHGRASTVVFGNTEVIRPKGQVLTGDKPSFQATERLDYELELGAVLCGKNAIGTSISLSNASEHILGYVLLNDWSARDIQAWEYQPLGPFLGKSFMTSVSSWIVPHEALKRFQVEGLSQNPEPLDYLTKGPVKGLDIDLKVELGFGDESVTMGKSNAKDLYWSFGQMLAHHSSNGCAMNPGDLLGSGTISGSTMEACGCMLELTSNGGNPFKLSNSEARTFLQDGDEVILKGRAQKDGIIVGFGEIRNKILPAI